MDSDTYPDSSFLVSFHRADSNRSSARAYMAARAVPLMFTPLHRIEFHNALRNLTARGEIAESECRLVFGQVEDDLSEGILVHKPIPWTQVFRRADELSAAHASTAGQRTLDLLHVAIAVELQAAIFLSFDARQRRLAAAAGLLVKP